MEPTPIGVDIFPWILKSRGEENMKIRRHLAWLLALLLFTLGDVLYVFYQDRCVFPHTIDRYREYRKTTPFLIPTASSIKEALASFK